MKRLFSFLFCLLLAVSFVSLPFPAYAADHAVPYADVDHPPEDGGSASTGMFDTTAQLGKALMDGIWSLFGIYVPGFSFTFGQMWVGVLLASVSILVVRMMFGFGGSRGESPRTGSTNNPRISKERRHDEF